MLKKNKALFFYSAFFGAGKQPQNVSAAVIFLSFVIFICELNVEISHVIRSGVDIGERVIISLICNLQSHEQIIRVW